MDVLTVGVLFFGCADEPIAAWVDVAGGVGSEVVDTMLCAEFFEAEESLCVLDRLPWDFN